MRAAISAQTSSQFATRTTLSPTRERETLPSSLSEIQQRPRRSATNHEPIGPPNSPSRPKLLPYRDSSTLAKCPAGGGRSRQSTFAYVPPAFLSPRVQPI